MKLDKSTYKKIGSLIAVLLVLTSFLYFTGLSEDFSIDKLQRIVKDAGAWGVIVYLLLFSLCLMMYFPGTLFIFIAVMLYGPIWGTVLAYVGAILASGSNFILVRKIGGQPIEKIKNKHFLKVASKIDEHPVKTVFWIRVIFWLAPYITYFLAFSSIKQSKYHLGNAIGMVPVVLFFALGFYFFQDWMMSVFGQ